MAITFIEKRKRLKYLFPVLAILIFITVIIIWRGRFAEIPSLVSPQFEIPVKKIEIDFEVLRHHLLEKLQPFPEIEPFTKEVGRENPFISY